MRLFHQDFWVTTLRVVGVALVIGGLPALVVLGDQWLEFRARSSFASRLTDMMPYFGPLFCGLVLLALSMAYRRFLRRGLEDRERERGYPGSLKAYLAVWAWSIVCVVTVLAAGFFGR